jgi:hypothetical protein
MRKFIKTLRIALTLIMARTFGTYKHSGWTGEFEYASYEWRGQEWCVPMTPCEKAIKAKVAGNG